MKNTTQAIINAINEVDDRASQGAMVPVGDVRKAFKGFGFNIYLWEAVQAGLVCIHKHDCPWGASESERDEMFSPDGKDFYNGLSIRQ